MGVMSCARRECENIMCHTIVDGNYICHECSKEFTEILGDVAMTPSVMLQEFRKFMDTPKNQAISGGEPITAEQFIELHEEED